MKNKRRKLLIVIPAFNEEKTLPIVLKQIPNKIKYINKSIILVIDDGSYDNTCQVAQKKALVLRHSINRGLGASITTGFEMAKKLSVDCMITIDADCQHDPKVIPQFVEKVLGKKFDVVVGSRLKKSPNKMPFSRKVVNRIANITTFLITGFWSTDSQSGYRAFSKKAICKMKLTTQRMEVSSEIFREVKNNKLRYTEIPIKPIYTPYSLKKGQSILNAPNVLFKLIIRTTKI